MVQSNYGSQRTYLNIIFFFSRRISNFRLFKSSLFAVGGTVCAVSKTWPLATPISICQQSYFAYMLYHRRKPLNSKYAINSKTQACFLFLGTKEQIPRSSLDFSSQYLFRLVNFTQFHSISISSLCGHLQPPPIEYSRLSFLSLKSNLKSIVFV